MNGGVGAGSGASAVVVSGNGIKMAAVNKSASFVINGPEETTKDYTVAISSPTGEVVEVSKMTRKPDMCVVEYEPFEVGPHQIRLASLSFWKLRKIGQIEIGLNMRVF